MFCIGVVNWTVFSVRVIERYEKKDFKAWFKKKQSKYVSNHFVSGRLFEKGSTMGVQSQSRVLSNSWWDGGCLKGALGAMWSQRATSLITPNFSAHTIEFPSNLLLVMLRNIKTKGWILFLPPWIVRSFPQTYYYASTKNPFDKADINFTVSLQYGVNRLIKVSPHGHLS